MGAYFCFLLSSLASSSLPQFGLFLWLQSAPCCLILQVETNDYKYLHSGKPKALNNSVKSRQEGNYRMKPLNTESWWRRASESRLRQKDTLGETQTATGAGQNQGEEEEQEWLLYVLKMNVWQTQERQRWKILTDITDVCLRMHDWNSGKDHCKMQQLLSCKEGRKGR